MSENYRQTKDYRQTEDYRQTQNHRRSDGRRQVRKRGVVGCMGHLSPGFYVLLAGVVCVTAVLTLTLYMLLAPPSTAAGAPEQAHAADQKDGGDFAGASAVIDGRDGDHKAASGTDANGSSSVSAGGQSTQEHLDASQLSLDWELTLVNPWNSLPEDFDVTLTQLKNGHSVDERCYPQLQAMMDDCRAQGLSPVICSSYRTREFQESLYDAQVNKLISQGCSREDAEAKAGEAIAVPGTSEHQLGLALDIVDINNQNLDETQEDTPVQQWLMENSWKYGFILRYPTDKSDITGIKYEPWHYRYVGRENAEKIHEQGLCLEEFISLSNRTPAGPPCDYN